jgi:hypothetical protein
LEITVVKEDREHESKGTFSFPGSSHICNLHMSDFPTRWRGSLFREAELEKCYIHDAWTVTRSK